RFMDRQPKVRRMNYQIIFSRRDRFGFELGHRFFTRLFGFLQPRVGLEILVTDAFWPRKTAARLEIAGASVDRPHGEKRQRANDILIDPRSIAGGEELLLILKGKPRRHETGALRFHGGFVQLQQKFGFLVDSNLEGIFLKMTLPGGRRSRGGDQLYRLSL